MPRERSKLLSFSQVMEKKKARRPRPQPWIVRKITVGLVLSLWGWCAYVYTGRLCAPMIGRWENAMGSLGMGVGLVIGFSILWLMFGWTYAMVIFTPPGYAKDYVEKTPPPWEVQQPVQYGYDQARGWEQPGGAPIGTPYEDMTRGPAPKEGPMTAVRAVTAPIIPPPVAHVRKGSTQKVRTETSSGSSGQPQHKTQSRRPPIHQKSSSQSSQPSQRPSHKHPQQPAQGSTNEVARTQSQRKLQSRRTPTREASQPGFIPPQPPQWPQPLQPYQPAQMSPQAYNQPTDGPTRRPPTHPVLTPEYLYCRKEGLVKPWRAHHCSVCGKCVLMYDHHCPWIGQCVGMHNRKFFVNFLEWSSLFTSYTFASLVALNARNGSRNIDGQQIGIIILTGLFTIFTGSLLVTHWRLLTINATTVEQMDMSNMQEDESEILSQMFEVYEIRKKRRVRRQWDEEWGRIGKEGNLWWLGSKRKNWEQVMGTSVLGWFLPIGRTPGDGLTFERNPRFDPQGRWMRRRDWPTILR